MKGFSERQVLEAIAHGDYTYRSVAAYLAENFAKDGGCSDVTAKAYIEKYGDRTLTAFRNSAVSLRDDSLSNIRAALRRGDVKTSKWVLERIDRAAWGNELTVNQKNARPINISFQGELFSEEELRQSAEVEIPEYRSGDGNEEKEG